METIPIGVAYGHTTAAAPQPRSPQALQAMDPNLPEIIAEFATVGIGSLAALCAIGVGIHAYIRRMRRKDAPRPVRYEDEDRLARIEQAVDAIAIEVERIAESQRFLTKLQTDRTDDRLLKR
jgi:hypothetical protein